MAKITIMSITRMALALDENSDKIALALRSVCRNELKDTLFMNNDGTNIFGTNPDLIIQSTENDFAQKLISEIEKIDFVDLIENKSYSEFDIVNECFGHFVRENFRNNKEDVQYMTPYEITKPVLDIIFNDIKQKNILLKTICRISWLWILHVV